MRMIRGWLVAAMMLCCTSLALPTAAAASPGVGVTRDAMLTRIDETLDAVALISTAPATVRNVDGDRRQFDRARRDADMAAALTLSRSASPIAISPLEVGAHRAGSVFAQG